MRKVIRITKSEQHLCFYGGTYITEEVHYRETESEALEYIRQEFAKDFVLKDFKIEHVDFDEVDKKSIETLTKEKKWKNSKKS